MLKSLISSTPDVSLLVCDDQGTYRCAGDDEILRAAQRVLAAQLTECKPLDSPSAATEFLRARLGTREHEVFAVLLLDVRHRVVDYLEIFRGTLAQTSVYPREVVKESLMRNAAAVILVHNHPSGGTTPSQADEWLTETLKSAFRVFDIRVLDHFIVTANEVFSFAKHGLL